MNRPIPLRTIYLIPAALALLAGADAALLLLGVKAPVSFSRLAEVHGYLMTLGFVGTLIALERAVALKRWWGFLSPAALGLGSVLLLSPVPLAAAFSACFVGILAMCANYIPLWKRSRDAAILVQLLGSVTGACATLLLIAGVPIRVLVAWLATFLILTIFGERLELARVSLLPRDAFLLFAASLLLVFVLAVSLLWPALATSIFGGLLLSTTLWLASKDVARKLVRSSGQSRFMASCMIGGYTWLCVAALIWMGGPAFQGPRYDAVIHGVFLGFTMSMIMAHASTILPAVIRRPLPYRSVMWIPAVLLHVSLLLRIWLGDFLGFASALTFGGVLNVVSVVGFFAVAIVSCTVGSRFTKRPEKFSQKRSRTAQPQPPTQDPELSFADAHQSAHQASVETP